MNVKYIGERYCITGVQLGRIKLICDKLMNCRGDDDSLMEDLEIIKRELLKIEGKQFIGNADSVYDRPILVNFGIKD